VIKTEKKNSREIIALDIFEAVRLRPQMYVGQVLLVEEKLPLILNGKLVEQEREWSEGFNHLLVEIFENALDEAKRCKGKMKEIGVKINVDTNEILVTDTGLGFHEASKKHKKTKKNVVRTAYEDLHAGSNFSDTDLNILGTHGVGAAVTNMLSEVFTVTTVNKTHFVKFVWNDFKVIKEQIRIREANESLGTTVSFIPSNKVFPGYKWDKDILSTYLSFKYFLVKNDPVIKNLKISCSILENGQEREIPIIDEFTPENCIIISSNVGTIRMWESYNNSCSISFVNGSECTGIHQKVVNDWVNEYFKYPYAHHFYETLISLNVPSTLMKFADQNKTRYSVGKAEIEEFLENNFKTKLLRSLQKSQISGNIEKLIEDKLYSENISKIRKAKRQSKRKISDKFSPSSKTKGSIFITEGLSAGGGVKQARDANSEAVYSIKGKIKNAKKLSDITSSNEWLDIMGILDIEPGKCNTPAYDRIIIACDSDNDGAHIKSLIIGFFHKWFPDLIKEKKLYSLITPLVSCDFRKDRKYFYSMDEFMEFQSKNSISNIKYIKGLGSLSLQDWKYIMNNKMFFSIISDKSAKKYLDIAFGADVSKRKEFLSKR